VCVGVSCRRKDDAALDARVYARAKGVDHQSVYHSA
jgi:hypothetical protein